MTLFEGLFSFITASTPINSALLGGIRPVYVPQKSPIPMLVIKFISGSPEPPTHDTGASSWTRMRIELTVWGDNIKINERIVSKIHDLFSPFNGYLGGSTNVYFCVTSIAGPRTVTSDADRLIGVQIDILGMLNRATLS